jgi:type II restriction enzyme
LSTDGGFLDDSVRYHYIIKLGTAMIDSERIQAIIQGYKNDPESVYNTWFINNEERLKAFGAIRRGVEEVIADIKNGRFPADFKGSSLETVLTAITEQKQVFKGAAHPFYWKPKMRIPDIYENDTNKKTFGQFLESCLKTNNKDQVIKEIIKLSHYKIKGLGPAVANILYFIHPTSIPPFNTAMVNGFNLIFKEKKKLGSWNSYLEMRDTILYVNEEFKNVLSKDLGALSGLLFDIGVGKIVVDENVQIVIASERKKREKLLKKRHEEVQQELEEENMHTKIQYLLLKIGKSLGYDVIAASNDRTKSFDNENFSFISLTKLPDLDIENDVNKTVNLIDVIWLERGTNKIVCAYEVEKSTSIYSGILRLTDLALTFSASERIMLYLVAPEQREKEIIAQLKRPSIAGKENTKISYILFSELCEHCAAICKFGDNYTIMEKVARYVA